ncbi:MAG TPA: hypothetical protein VK778_07135 [Solirubrobacteraceae bacterium]|nr:hypothetical protein [Solirubrobacteraceae bacterium]
MYVPLLILMPADSIPRQLPVETCSATPPPESWSPPLVKLTVPWLVKGTLMAKVFELPTFTLNVPVFVTAGALPMSLFWIAAWLLPGTQDAA